MLIKSLTLHTKCSIEHHFWKLSIDMTSEDMYKNQNIDLSNIEISKDVS